MKKRYDKELSIEELAAMPDDQIDYSDIPELDEAFWKNARLVAPEGTQAIRGRFRAGAK